MAEKQQKTASGRKTGEETPESKGPLFFWPFSLRNLWFLLGGIAVIVLGYVLLAKGPYDSAASLTIGPILLVIGYLVLVPLAILVRDRRKARKSGE